MVLSPQESGKFIVQNAKSVIVKEKGIEKIKKAILEGIEKKEIDVDNFLKHDLHPHSHDKNAANWIFVIDTLNFCFWTPGDATKWKVNNQTGYYALCSAIKRAIDEKIDITNPEYFSKITSDDLSRIMRSDDGKTIIPLFQERIACLHEVGKILLEKFNGDFENCVRLANHSAQNLIQIVVDNFSCFRDEAHFNKEHVSLYKRAQILVGDLWACYSSEGLGQFNDIQTITMFADYRIPQVLVYFGALEYTNDLMSLLKEDTILRNGSAEEVEIRGASIYIVELLKTSLIKELELKHPNVSTKNINSIFLDFFLWDYRRKFAQDLEYIPFHKCISIYY